MNEWNVMYKIKIMLYIYIFFQIDSLPRTKGVRRVKRGPISCCHASVAGSAIQER
jgi:hypothetical protein